MRIDDLNIAFFILFFFLIVHNEPAVPDMAARYEADKTTACNLLVVFETLKIGFSDNEFLTSKPGINSLPTLP